MWLHSVFLCHYTELSQMWKMIQICEIGTLQKNHKQTKYWIFVHVESLGGFCGSIEKHNSLPYLVSNPCKWFDLSNCCDKLLWHCCTNVHMDYGHENCAYKMVLYSESPHSWLDLQTINILIKLCISGISLGSDSSINASSPCKARPTIQRTSLVAMSLSYIFCHQCPADKMPS